MKTVLLIGDIHLSPKYLKRSLLFLEDLKKIIEERTIDSIVLLGDVFDDHEWIHVACLSAWNDFVSALPITVDVYHLLGNHEMMNSNSYLPNVHALTSWEGMHKYIVVDKPFSLGNGIALMPYVPSGRFKEALGELIETPRLVFCHQEFVGSVREGKGDPCPEVSTISGHIHTEAVIESVWYPGSPYQTNFGEDPNKFIYILEINDSLLNPYRVKEKIAVDVPRLETYEFDLEQPVVLPLLMTNSEKRFVIHGTKAQLTAYRHTTEYLAMADMGKIQFKVKKEERSKKNNENKSFAHLFLEYVGEEGLESIYSEIMGEGK